MMPVTTRLAAVVLAGAAVVSSSGCALVYRLGIGLYYDRVDLPAAQTRRNLPYVDGASDKQRLDLFLPTGKGFSTVVFVHGGGWDEGDRQLRVGGADVYSNIGRFFASQGIGAAVISYRLQPAVDWKDQVGDVAAAVGWVHRRIAEYGGRADAIVLMGHSAGAQLAAHVALDERRREAAAVPHGALRGVIAVSGAGYDLADARTYELGNDPEYYAKRFADSTPDWQRVGSPVTYLSPDDPPFLVMFATGETEPLKHQARLFHDRLGAGGVSSELLAVPGYSHTRIVLALSRPDKVPGPAMIDFVNRVTTNR